MNSFKFFLNLLVILNCLNTIILFYSYFIIMNIESDMILDAEKIIIFALSINHYHSLIISFRKYLFEDQKSRKRIT